MKIFSTLLFVTLLFVMLLLSAAALAQETGSISGQVVTDSGKPLSNFSVSITSTGANRSRGVSRSTSTDEEGRFQFNKLPDLNYGISFGLQKGYIPDGSAKTTGLRLGETVAIKLTKGGVITGRVTTPGGEPLAVISVSALRIRDQEGGKVSGGSSIPARATDDRGIYRLYGLPPGTYLVVANGGGQSAVAPALSPYHGEVPTYHPSSTRDTAAEIKVGNGEEISGVDIRYRGEMGRVVSGKVSGGEAINATANVVLRHAQTGAITGGTFVMPTQTQSGFAIASVSDGEYELTASRGNLDSGEFFYSEPRRVTVKGADVTGIELRLLAAASIAGRVTLEKSPNVCDFKPILPIEDTRIFAQRDKKPDDGVSSPSNLIGGNDVADEKGEFKINSLRPGLYRLTANPPNETWFVKSISAPAPAGKATTAKPAVNDLSRTNLTLKSGENFSGVTIIADDGGASLQGKVAAKEGEKLPARAVIHLIPAEPAAADDLLRYAERGLNNKGEFTFNNLAPGKYRLLVRALPESDELERPKPPAHWDAAERARLRKDAEAGQEIELKPCQRVKDHQLTKSKDK